jgi:hypothetical protein
MAQPATPKVDPNPPAVQARPYGLRAVLRTLGSLVDEPDDNHWFNGVIWEYLTCAPASGVGPDCDTPLGIPKTFERHDTVTDDSTPFALYGSYDCSPMGRPFNEAIERASAQLAMHEDFGIEKTIWDGSLNNTPVIMSSATENLTPGSTGTGTEDGTPTTPTGAISILEQFADENYGGLGLIHIPRATVPFFVAQDQLEKADGIIRTFLEHPVAAGSGYVVNTGPAGNEAPAAVAWAAITPLPKLFRSKEIGTDRQALDTLDRATNDSLAIAERLYVAQWDGCPVAAVKFNLDCSC